MANLRDILTEPDVWNPLVAPDGDHVAWLSTTSDRPAVHVAPTGGGEEQILVREALSGHPSTCHCWALDSESVWLLRVPDDDLDRTTLWQVTLSGDVISRIPLGGWSWLHGVTEAGVIIGDWNRTVADSGDLFRVEPETGRCEQLTDHDRMCGAVTVNPDGRLAYVVRDRFDGADDDLAGNAVIRNVDGTKTVLGDDVHPVAWDDDRLLLVSDAEENAIGIRSGDGGIDWLGPGVPLGFFDTDRVLALRDGVPVLLPSEQTLPWNDEPVTGGSVEDERAAFVTRSTDNIPSRIIGWGGVDTTTLTAPEFVVPPQDLATPDSVTFTDSAGEERQAWLLVPEERTAPCIVHLYGFTPERGDFDRKFGRPLRYLRDHGSAILVPAHGGETYSERRHADYAAAAKWASEQEWSDERVVALGHSSGGYDVLMQATHHPGPWVAGIAWNGVADVREFHDVMAKDHGFFERELGDEGLDRLNRLSPASKPDGVGFPLLVIQGEQDWITDQIRDFVADARAEGANIEYEEIAGTGHWTRDLDVTVQIWSRIEKFLGRSL